MNKHYVVIMLGLGETLSLYRWFTRHWEKKYNLIPIIQVIGWKNTSIPYNTKLLKLENTIKMLTRRNHIVSLIGISAGASAVINTYYSLKKKDVKIRGKFITICGRFNMSAHWWYPLWYGVKRIPQFEASVNLANRNLKKLTKKEKGNIIVFRAIFDEVVPSSASMIKGAKNVVVGFPSHNLTIYALFLLETPLIPILKSVLVTSSVIYGSLVENVDATLR